MVFRVVQGYYGVFEGGVMAEGIKIIAENRRARAEYALEET